MGGSLLDAAFAHHVWATSRVIDACIDLSEEDLAINIPGTRGPILERFVTSSRVTGPLDPDAVVQEVDESDGFQRWAPVGYRLAGTLDHGKDHRSQLCTALTTIGVPPPKIGVMDFGIDGGQVVEEMREA